MKNTHSTLWIDVTMLANWSGHLTGIQRVEYNLAKRFAEKDNVKFCVFHKSQRILTEFDFKHIAYKIDVLQHRTTDASAKDTIDEAAAMPTYQRLVTQAKRVAAPILSDRSKTYLRRQHSRLSKAIKRQELTTDPPITFSSQDTFLILSGDWSDDVFASMVAGMRTQSRCRVVQIVYDMLPALFPGYFVPGMPEQFTAYMRQMLANCDRVLAISESTRRDVLRFAKQEGLAKVPVDIFRLGDNFVKQDPVKPNNAAIKKGQYVMCVCTIEARKNHNLLFLAAREAIGRGEDFPTTVVVGKRGWLINDLLYLIENDPVLSKKFIFQNCTDRELAWLYQNCLFTIFPSYYEGWGLPVAESMFYGKFCLSSGASSMPEIAGDLVDYVSPNDPIALLEKIQHYVADGTALAKKEQRIATKYKPTSWDDTFVEVEKFISVRER